MMKEETAKAFIEWLKLLPVASLREQVARRELFQALFAETFIPDCADPDAKPPTYEWDGSLPGERK